jgi:FkbM family methyltransferase
MVIERWRTSLLKQAAIYAWQNRWLTQFSRAALRAPIVGPALRRAQEWALPPGKRVWVRVNGGLARGFWIQADPYREQEYLRGTAEPGVQEALATYLKPGGCFFDVGAHVGLYSLIASQLVGIRGQVVAFEPDPQNAQLLRKHATRNSLCNISVAEVAAMRSNGKVLFLRGGGQLTGRSSRRGTVVEAAPPNTIDDVITIRAVSLDQFAEGDYSPTLIKIDVEGAECEVLKGAERLLAEVKPTLICEVHQAQAATFIAEFLPARHYMLQWLPERYRFPFPRHLLAIPSHY